ncbi:MAG: DNA polymerase III subunit gamma/tau [Burkholderiaceae bacterium]|nr:MAG: DNA polymerase III subunit gamma/tau [Burkholderiaceae bacterium]
MSYLVLARKYRPRNFSEVVGQEHVVRALTHALEQKRLHHAYLFTGTRGIGKTTISRILAKSLNCVGSDGQGDVTATPCGACPACTAIDAGRFVDYTELDAASNRGVDEVQALLEQAVYKPVQGRFKVFMIDEVHMLSNTAFNAMLKTLEEPPEYLKFVLATTDPQKVPVTVLSRCLQFNLRPMAPETVMAQLQHILELEHLPAEPAALGLLARSAHGSMRDALSLTDQAIAYGGGDLKAEAVRRMLGSIGSDVVFQLIDALAAADGRRVVDFVDQLRADGQSAAAVLEDMARCLQRMAVRQAVPDTPVDAADPDAAIVARLAGALPADETQLLYSLCIHGRSELGLAPDEYVGLTMTLLRLLPFKVKRATEPSLPAEKKTPDDVDSRLTAAPVLAPHAESRSSDSATPLAAGRPRSESTPAQARGTGSTASSAAAGAGDAIGRGRDSATVAPNARVAQPTDAHGRAAARNRPEHADESKPVSALPQEMPDAAANAKEAVSAAQTVSTLAVVEREASDNPAQESIAAERSDEPSPAGDDAGAFWYALVARLARKNAITALSRELALQSQLVERGEGAWRLRVENAALGRDAARERLEAAIMEAGHAVRLAIEVGSVTDTPAQRREAIAGRRLEAATAAVMADPFVQKMMQEFGARIIPGSIQPL